MQILLVSLLSLAFFSACSLQPTSKLQNCNYVSRTEEANSTSSSLSVNGGYKIAQRIRIWQPMTLTRVMIRAKASAASYFTVVIYKGSRTAEPDRGQKMAEGYHNVTAADSVFKDYWITLYDSVALEQLPTNDLTEQYTIVFGSNANFTAEGGANSGNASLRSEYILYNGSYWENYYGDTRYGFTLGIEGTLPCN